MSQWSQMIRMKAWKQWRKRNFWKHMGEVDVWTAFSQTIISFHLKKTKKKHIACMHRYSIRLFLSLTSTLCIETAKWNKPQSFTYYPSSNSIPLWTFETVSLEKVNGKPGELYLFMSEKTLRGILHAAFTGSFSTASCTHFRLLPTLSLKLVSICLYHKMFDLKDVYFCFFIFCDIIVWNAL